MITEWLISIVFGFVGFLVGLFPTIDLPTWVATATTYLHSGIDATHGLRFWFPLEAMRNAFLFVGTAGATVLAVRVLRILISHFTGGGGAAA